MKNILKIFLPAALVTFAVVGCDDNDDVNAPKPATAGNDIKANFLGINAVADGSALSFFVNGVPVSTSDAATSQGGYTAVQIQTGFSGTNAIANTAIRAKATSGAIGGLLGSNDLLYRAGNTSINNLVANANGLYTLIALDSLKRPIPSRTFSINTATNALAADITYYNRADGTQISNDQYKALPTQAAKDKCVSLGTVPAGTTDVGGPRFLLLTDTYPTFAGGNVTQSGVRVINAIPNSYSTPTNTRISVRLRPASGPTVTLGTNLEYALSVPGGFSPSVGSRATTTSFSLQTTATSSGPGNSTPIVYTLEASTDGFTTIAASVANVQLQANKVYTIVAKGIIGKSATLGLIVVQHN